MSIIHRLTIKRLLIDILFDKAIRVYTSYQKKVMKFIWLATLKMIELENWVINW